jgi:DNA-binding transcriptional MerR regulator
LGVSREIIEHRLQVNPNVKPKKKKLRKMSEEKIEAVKAEVQRLLDACFIWEVAYPQWLANIVMVMKKNGKWRMCIDFTYLNKCCPKDDFLLARIDKIVDSAAGCEMMTLLVCFSGYHQIWLRGEDEEKTSFITHFDTYCYLRMSEGLWNTCPTFCRMTKATLKDQVGRNVLSYVGDIVVASKKKATYISDLAETFTNICEARLKLNLEKCIFGVTRGNVLGCLIFTKCIEANLKKIKAILQMQPPQTKKEVQKLTSHVADLNKFIAKLAEWSLPFLNILRGSVRVEWGPEQQKAFEDLKFYLQQLPIL